MVRHRPESCRQCGEDLRAVPGRIAERRQVLDLPEIRLLAHEHQVEAICCPTCHTTSVGRFPASVSAPVQYGPNLQALALYLHQEQLLPTARTCEALEAMCGCQISEATLLQWSDLLGVTYLDAQGNEHPIQMSSYGIGISRLMGILVEQHHDEKGIIWPAFTGRGMHDRFASSDGYDCAYSICGAHLLRDCLAVAQQPQQDWAQQMHDFLLDLHDACQQWHQLQLSAVPAIERDDWIARYFEILATGYAAQAPPAGAPLGKAKGKPKQSSAKNLLDALLGRAEQVLALLDDLSIPFTNNQAERDLRMAKVQQKISGTFRSATGATAFCHIRSYLSTMQKQGHPMLAALAAVFHGHPFPVAWSPE